jgi:hypothetical protein
MRLVKDKTKYFFFFVFTFGFSNFAFEPNVQLRLRRLLAYKEKTRRHVLKANILILTIQTQ